ncbi:MAG: hypothetical protein WC869_02230 [Phycisphaerae bacterium]|jgi:hypothetical protein
MHKPHRRRISQIVFDRKMDYNHIPGQYGRDHWVHLNVHDRGFWLALQPPPGVPIFVWINIISSLIAIRGMLIASAVCLVKMIYFLVQALNTPASKTVLFPDFRLLLDVALAAPMTLWGSKIDYGKTLINLLWDVVVRCQAFEAFAGLDIDRDVISQGKSCVIEIPTLYPAWLRLFIVDLIVAQILYGRIHRQQKTEDTEVIIYLDEADQDLTVAASDGPFSDGYSVMAQLLRMGREFGISCVVGLGVLGHISEYVSSSFQYTFIFNISEGGQKLHAARNLSLPRGAEEMLPALDSSCCILRESLGAWPHPVWCKVDHLPPHRGPLNIVYDECPHVPSQRLHDLPHVMEALARLRTDSHQSLQDAKSTSPPAKKLSEDGHKLLNAAALNPWWPVAQLWEKAQLRLAPAAQTTLCNGLAELGCAEFKEDRFSSTNVRLIRLTPAGLALFNRDPLPAQGRGDIVHQHISHWVAMVAASEGLKAACEFEINGHPVDCAVTGPDGQVDAHEIIVGCTDNVLHHLEVLKDSPVVRTITVVCLQKRISQRLQHSLREKSVVKALGERLRFGLAGHYLRRLWPCD